MADGALSIKLRCASWHQLATIYKRDLSHGTMFLKAASPPPIGTSVHIDLALPSATVVELTGVVQSHLQDPQRGAGVELKLAPIPTGSVWLIESALASEHKRLATPVQGVPVLGAHQMTSVIPTIGDSADVTEAEHDLIKALVSEAESLKKLNPFLVLGVGYEATDAEVRAAFGDLTKRYHPDRFARYESAELRQVAAEIFILIRDAYRKLGDAAARSQLLQALGKSAPPRAIPAPPRPSQPVPPPRPTQRVPVISPAQTASIAPTADARRGTSKRPAGEPAQATPLPPVPLPPAPPASNAPGSGPPRRAASDPGSSPPPNAPLSRRAATDPGPPPPSSSGPRRAATDPGSPSTPVHRRSASQPPPVGSEPIDVSALEELIDQGKLDDALAAYRAMVKKHPHDRNVRAGVELCEGLRASAARDRLEAAQRFEAALEIDPSNERAARELADMRRQATNERKGLLSRLMGKKEP
jgi:hypothetical protein